MVNLGAVLLSDHASKMAELTPKKRSILLHLIDSGNTQASVAKYLKVNQSTVSRTVSHARRGLYAPSLVSRQRSGRPQKISPLLSRKIKKMVEDDPFVSSVKITQQLKTKTTARCVRMHIQKKLNLKAYSPAKKPLLSHKNLADRMEFCTKYRSWTPQQWKSVMFSDECKIVQFGCTRQYVRRPTGERYRRKFTTPSVKNPISVMIWGASPPKEEQVYGSCLKAQPLMPKSTSTF